MTRPNETALGLFERYTKLQTVVKLRALIRRIWKIDVEFADADGKIFDPNRGRAVSANPNQFCDQCLLDRDGLKKCDKTAREILQEIRSKGSRSAALHDQCHVGFRYFSLPVHIDEDLVGSVLVGGFLTEAPTAEKAAEILANTAPYRGTVIADPAAALVDVPVFSESQINSLEQVISFGLEEVLRFHEEDRKRTAAIMDLGDVPGRRHAGTVIVGESPAMRSLFSLLDKLRESDSTVLIQGENGTGKELVARAIHHSSVRKEKTFITQNCSALNDNLLDSELFGHVRGSFTGAIRDKKGLFEVADGGTFFMDEVGDMSPMLQVKLLRVLQEGMVVPVGGTEPKYVDVRIIAATNQDLKKMVEDGRFREDLYYRLNVISVAVPPLRDRREDIPILVEHFLGWFSHTPGMARKLLTPEAIDALMAYNWPGNIRQLENEIQRAMVLSGKSHTIDRDVLSPAINMAASSSFQVKIAGRLRAMLEQLERQILLDGLRRHKWNKSRLSKELGISRTSLIWKIDKYGITTDART